MKKGLQEKLVCPECLPRESALDLKIQETSVKCDLCVERLKNAQAPACYSVCPTHCISWGETKTLSERLVREALPQKMQ